MSLWDPFRSNYSLISHPPLKIEEWRLPILQAKILSFETSTLAYHQISELPSQRTICLFKVDASTKVRPTFLPFIWILMSLDAVSRIKTSGGLVRLWNKKRNYWMRKTRPPEPPHQLNAPQPDPSQQQNALELDSLEIDPVQFAEDAGFASAGEEVASPATSGEDEPMDYNDHGDRRINPPRPMRREIRQDLRRHWRFAKVIYQPEGFMSHGVAGRGIYLFLLHNDQEAIIDVRSITSTCLFKVAHRYAATGYQMC